MREQQQYRVRLRFTEPSRLWPPPVGTAVAVSWAFGDLATDVVARAEVIAVEPIATEGPDANPPLA